MTQDETTQPLRPLQHTQKLRLEANFDTAKQVSDGGTLEWTAADFNLLPLIERIRLLSTGQVRFFRAGAEIPAREALREY